MDHVRPANVLSFVAAPCDYPGSGAIRARRRRVVQGAGHRGRLNRAPVWVPDSEDSTGRNQPVFLIRATTRSKLNVRIATRAPYARAAIHAETGRRHDVHHTGIPDERDLIRSLHEAASRRSPRSTSAAPVLYSLALRIVGSRERAACVLEDLYEEIWRDRASWRASTAGLMGGAAGVRRPFSAAGAPGAISGGSRATIVGPRIERRRAPANSGSFPGEIPLIAWIARCRELALAQVGPDPHSSAHPPPSGNRRARRRVARSRRALRTRSIRAGRGLFPRHSPREIMTRIGAPTTDAGMMLRNALARFRDYADQGAEDGEAAEARRDRTGDRTPNGSRHDRSHRAPRARNPRRRIARPSRRSGSATGIPRWRTTCARWSGRPRCSRSRRLPRIRRPS